MPITASDLIQGRDKPVTTTMDTPIVDALRTMQQHEFSQLPIVDSEYRQKGIITSESILRAQTNLGASIEKLKVSHAARHAATTSTDDNLFDVFELFHKHSAVLVVDSDDTLIGIITPWDAAEHLQQRVEDFMLVEDIESALKDHIQAAFTDGRTGKFLESERDAAIQRIVDKSQEILKEVISGLKQYFERAQIKHKMNKEIVQISFKKIISSDRDTKTFAKLTMSQYIDLLLCSDRWPQYSGTFNLDSNLLKNLLDDVRKTRNDLAHFRDEISSEQRDQLRYCADFFDRHPVPEIKVLMPTRDSTIEVESLDVEPTEDELAPGESRYALLSLYLQQLPADQQRVELTFEDVEAIIGSQLPVSARQHRSWWANDSVSHSQSRLWLESGWRVARINVTEGRVVFARSPERSQAYIHFFSQLLDELRSSNLIDVRDASPNGANWVVVTTLPRGEKPRAAMLNYSFSLNGRFRVEFYVDTGNRDQNKRIFDRLLEQREAIEADMGEPLTWEPLRAKRASRIAAYSQGRITDSDEKLSQLREWAVDRMIRLEHAIADRAEEAIKSVF